MLCIFASRVDCFAKWFSYKRLRRIIPQIPQKLHYISSLAEVPEERVRGGLSLIANLIVVFILERRLLVIEGFSALSFRTGFPSAGGKSTPVCFLLKRLPPSKATQTMHPTQVAFQFEDFLRRCCKLIGWTEIDFDEMTRSIKRQYTDEVTSIHLFLLSSKNVIFFFRYTVCKNVNTRDSPPPK